MKYFKIILLGIISLPFIFITIHFFSPKEVIQGKVINYNDCYVSVLTKENKTIDNVHCCDTFGVNQCKVDDDVEVKIVKYWFGETKGVVEIK